MSRANHGQRVLERLPDAASIRAKLTRSVAETRLLRRLLKLAHEKEQLRRRDAQGGADAH